MPDRWADDARARYERETDVSLAYSVLLALESGEIAISPLLADFDLGAAFTPRMPEPSTN